MTTPQPAATLFRLDALILRRLVRARSLRIRATLAAARPFGAGDAAVLESRAARLERQVARLQRMASAVGL